MKIKEYFKRPIRLQNFKKCIGCNNIYDLDILIEKCEICGGKQFL